MSIEKSPSARGLSPYEIVAPLGAGGIGEIYRAQSRRNQQPAHRNRLGIREKRPHIGLDLSWRREEGGTPRAAPRGGPVKVPTAFAAFPKERFGAPPRSVLAREFNLVRYTGMPRGGHFAALEQPTLFVEDVRTFFRTVRQ